MISGFFSIRSALAQQCSAALALHLAVSRVWLHHLVCNDCSVKMISQSDCVSYREKLFRLKPWGFFVKGAVISYKGASAVEDALSLHSFGASFRKMFLDLYVKLKFVTAHSNCSKDEESSNSTFLTVAVSSENVNN